MIQEANQRGLIISVGTVRHAAPLRELVRCTGWPTLFEATVWQLSRELSLRMPRLALFWLDREEHVAATVKLVAWLREARPAVWPVAVVYRLDADVELAVRSAGAQLYVPANGSIHGLLERSILALLREEKPRTEVAADVLVAPRARAAAKHRPPAVPREFRQHTHPP